MLLLSKVIFYTSNTHQSVAFTKPNGLLKEIIVLILGMKMDSCIWRHLLLSTALSLNFLSTTFIYFSGYKLNSFCILLIPLKEIQYYCRYLFVSFSFHEASEHQKQKSTKSYNFTNEREPTEEQCSYFVAALINTNIRSLDGRAVGCSPSKRM